MMIKVTCNAPFKLQSVRRPRGKGKGCLIWSFWECLPSCSGWVNKGVKRGSSYSVQQPWCHVGRQGQKRVRQATGFSFVLVCFHCFVYPLRFFFILFFWMVLLGESSSHPSHQKSYKPLLLKKNQFRTSAIINLFIHRILGDIQSSLCHKNFSWIEKRLIAAYW